MRMDDSPPDGSPTEVTAPEAGPGRPGVGPPALPPAAIVIGPIIVQSSATPAIGLLMLLAGLVAGFLLRPLVPTFGPAPPRAVAGATSAASGDGQPASPGIPTATRDLAAEATQAAGLAKVVLGHARHFRGDPEAPVTIIEY